jgi:hypothetical protein
VVVVAEQVEMTLALVQLLAELVEVVMLKHLALLFKMGLQILAAVEAARTTEQQMVAQVVLAL